MTPQLSLVLKAFSPRYLGKALRTFDRLTLWIICLCWATTLAVMMLALYTINLSTSAQKAAEIALATEPTLPTIKRSGIGGKELQVMVERLQRRYPDVVITWQNGTLTLAAANGGLYHQWLTAIGQVDTLYPQYHWKVKGLCVGKACGGNNIMSIDLSGETVSLEMPQIDEKR